MATMTEVIKKITMQATAVGVDQTASSLRNLANAQNENVVVQEKSSKSSLSAASALNTLQKSVDAEYRAEQQMERVHKTLTAARNEGLISIQRENELLTLAAEKYRVVGESAKLMGESMKLGKELAMGLVAGLGTGALFVGLAELPSKILETVHEAAGLPHVAETIGITTKALQELQYTGAQFHVSTETMDSALEKFSKNLGIAATGSGALAKILKENHVVITGDLNKDLLNYANLIAGATSAEQRNLLVTTAFGKNAEEMGLMFNEGAAGIKRAADEADAMGAVLDGTALASAQTLDREFIKMQAQIGVTFKEFTITIAPALIGTLQAITAAVQAANFVIKEAQPKSDDYVMDASGFAFPKGAIPGGIPGGQPIHIDKPTPPPHGSIDFDSGGFFTATKTPDLAAEAAAKAAAAAAAAAAASQAKAYASVTDALHLQLAALHETDLQKQIDLELSKAKVTASSREGIEITHLTTEIYDQKKALDAANQAEAFFAQTAETAFQGLISGGQSLTDVLGNVVKALEAAVIQAALLGTGPLAGLMGTAPTTAGGTGGFLGSLLDSLFHGGTASPLAEAAGTGSSYATGGVPPGGLSAWSNSIVSKPTPFRFASGAGLMGEAGPEAIMPLKRGPDGRLGVAAANSNEGLTVNVQIIRQPGSGEDRATVTRNGNKLDVKAFIKDTAAESAAQPGGAVNRAIRVGFGGKQSLTGRGQ